MTNAKMNFKNMHQDTTCNLCKVEEVSQQHYLQCQVLVEKCTELYNDRIVRYDDIFGNLTKQIRAVRLFEKVLKKRDELL